MVNKTPGFGSGITVDDGKAEGQFSNLINSVKDYAIFISDPKGFIKTWNEGAKYIKEYDAAQIIGQHISIFYVKEDRQKMLPQKLLEIAKAKGEARDEGWRVRKDGSRFWGDEVITTLFDHKKTISGFSHITRDLSRKHKQKEFDKNNLYALINNTPDLMWSVDANYNLITSNLAFDKVIRQMAGKPVEKGHTILEATYGQKQLIRYKKYYDRVFAGEKFTEVEYTGAPVESWVEISFYPIYEGRMIVGTACHAHDITSVNKALLEQKENAEKLKESELRLKEAQKMAHVGSWEIDFLTGVAEWSDELLKIYGLPMRENKQTYNSWISFIHPQDVEYVTRVTKESQTSPSNHAFFHRIVRRDGAVRHLFSQAHLKFDDVGKPIALYGIAHDITEMKEAENALSKSESNLRAIFENTSEGFILADTNGNVKAFNNKFRDIILMNTEKQIRIGDSIFKFILESRKDFYKEAVSKKVLSGETIRNAHSFKRKNGDVKWFDFIINPVYSAGKIVGLGIVCADITEAKEAEQSLRRSESNLKAVIENTDATIYSLDNDLRYITFNNRLKTTLKEIYDLDIKPGDHVYGFLEKLDPGESQNWKEMYSKALKGETVKFEKEFSINEYYNCSDFSIHPIWEKESVIGLSCFVLDITKQKQAENALIKSEFLYRQIVETAQEGIWLIDENSITTFVNHKMCEILEYSQEEILGKANFYFMDDAGKQLALQTLERRKKGLKEKIDLSFITKTGRNIRTSVSANPIFDEKAKYKGALGMVSDITEKILGDEMLRESERKYRELASELAEERTRLIQAQGVAKVGSWETDLQSLKINWSEETHRIFETDPQKFQVTYKIFNDFIHPEDRAKSDAAFSDSIQNGSATIEHRIITAKGHEKFVLENWEVYQDEKGIPIRAVGTCQDITERKKAEEGNRFKANLLNTIGQAVIGTNLNGLVNYWNKAAEKIYGWKEDEALGQNIVDLTPSYQTKEQALLIMQELKQGRSWSGECKVQRKDGTDFPVFITDSPVYDQDHTLTGLIGISSDITEKKTLEELLNKANQLARIGSWEVDLLKKTLYWSAITKQIHEVNVDFIPEPETAINFYKPGLSRETITHAIEEAINNRIPFDLELQIITVKENEKWVRVIGQAECIGDKCIRLYGSFQDIDAGKKAGIEILRAYEEKKIILESIADAFFAVDKNWVVTYWNNQAEKMLQTPKSKIDGRHLWDVFHDQLKSESYRKYHLAMETNRVVHFEEYYAPLGKWFAISAYPSLNGLSVYFKDVTEKKQADNALKQSEMRYRQIVETAHEGIWLINENNQATFVNQKMCEIFEYSQEEMLGKDIYYFMDAITSRAASELTERKAKAIPGNVDMPFITKSGKHIWASLSTSSIFDETGKYKGALAMVTNITERKILQQQLLAEQVNKQKDITKAVVNAQEKERAEIGSELHDNINQLLATSKLYLGHSLKQKDHAPFILQSQEYISTAMEEIRKLSHALVGPDKDKTMGLIDSLNELINNLSVEKNTTFSFNHSTYHEEETEAGLKIVIYRIVQEQLNNVMKHAKASKAEIEIKSKIDCLEVMINDNGKGFDTSAKRDGIGLQNIKNRAGLYNGVVQIVSSPGNGCKMKIIFKHNSLMTQAQI